MPHSKQGPCTGCVIIFSMKNWCLQSAMAGGRSERKASNSAGIWSRSPEPTSFCASGMIARSSAVSSAAPA
eukprot:3663901-Prorocentrum_lima.AAC.1